MISDDDAKRLLADVDVVDEGTGPVVALAHGAGGGVRENFGALLDGPADRRRLTGAYYPGAGGTPPADGPLSLDVLADRTVAAGIRAGGTRFPVLGLSLGAAVAVTAAVRHPEQVGALVLTVGLARADVQSRAFTSAWRALDRAGEHNALAWFLLHAASSPDMLAGLSLADAEAAVREIRRTYPPGGAAHAELAGRVDVTGLLADVRVPTLVVVAGRDRIVTPATARSFSAIPGSRVVEYPEAGHIFTATEAQAWAGDVSDFLDGR